MLANLLGPACDALAAPPGFLLRSSAAQPAIGSAAARGSYSGSISQPVTFADYQALHATLAVVSRCVGLNASNVALGRPSFYRGDDELPESHPLVELFSRVNDQMTTRDLLEWTVMGLDYTGNAYWELVRERAGVGSLVTFLGIPGQVQRDFGDGTLEIRLRAGTVVRAPARLAAARIVEIWPLNPARVTIKPGPFGVLAYGYKVGNEDPIVFGPDQILHFRYPDPADDWYGISPLRSASGTIVADGLAERADAAFLKNGARPSGLVFLEDSVTQQGQVDKIAGWFNAQFSGSQNAGKIVLLPKGRDYKPLSLTPAEAQSFERRKWNKTQLQQALGVYPIVYGMEPGDTSATRENATIQRKLYFENTILPRAERISAAITERLLPRLGIPGVEDVRCDLDFSRSPLFRELLATEAVAHAPLIAAGAVLVDDVRQLLAGRRPDFRPVPWGRKWFAAGYLPPVPAGDADAGEDEQPYSEPAEVPPMLGAGTPRPALAPAPALPVEAAGAAPADMVFNGAQLSAATAIVQAVADGLLPRDSGIGQLMVLFNLSREEAELIMGSVGEDFEQEPDAAPAEVSTPSAPSEPA